MQVLQKIMIFNIFNYRLCRTLFLMLTLFLFSCSSKQEQLPKISPKHIKKLEFIKVSHLFLAVDINFSGTVAPWKTEVIQSVDSLHLISLLVGLNEKVRRGQLLGSFLNLEQSFEYTPVDFMAPFDGLVTDIYYQLDQRTRKNTPLFKLINDDYHLIRIVLEPEQQVLIARGNTVIVFGGERKLQTQIERIDQKTGMAEVLIPRRISEFNLGDRINGVITTNPVPGDFIPLRFLSGQPGKEFYIDPLLSIDLRLIGVRDSLALIVPKIANIDSLGIL